MDPRYLSADEVEVECMLRNISGSVVEQLEQLRKALNLENNGQLIAPDKMHIAARKSPQRELNVCSEKLKGLQPQVTEISEISQDNRNKKLASLSTRVLHINSRLQRVINTSPTCKDSAYRLSLACDKFLEVIQSLLEAKVTVDEFEKSITEAIQVETLEQVGNTSCNDSSNSEQSESDDLATGTIRKKILPGTSSQSPNDQMESKTKLSSEKILSTQEYEILMGLIRKCNLTANNAPLMANDEQIQNSDSKCDLTSTPNKNVFISSSSSNVEAQKQTTHSNNSKADLDTSNDRKTATRFVGMDKWKNVEYDGSPNSEISVDRFLYRVERLARANNISSNQLVDGLYVLLRKSACAWYWSFLERNKNVCWEQLQKAMSERFKDRRSDAEIKQSVASIKQKPNESFIEFHSRVIDATIALSHPLPEGDLMFILKRNMLSSLQYKVAGRNIESVPDLVRQCVDIEDTWKRLNSDRHERNAYIRQINELSDERVFYENTPYKDRESPQSEHKDFNISGHQRMEPNYYIPTHRQQNTSKINDSSYNTELGYYEQVCAMEHTGRRQPENHVIQQRLHPSVSRNTFNSRNPIVSRHCFGCGTPNVIRPNCPSCNNPNVGNNTGKMSVPGTQSFQDSVAARTGMTDAASNTCPELFRRQL